MRHHDEGSHALRSAAASAAALLGVIFLAACGEDRLVPASDGPVLTSPVVLTSRPSGSFSGLAGLVSYDAVADQGTVTMTPMTGANEYSITTAGNGVICAFVRQINNKPYLFLGVNDSLDIFYLQSVHDQDADGLPDASTLTTHFTTGSTPGYFGAVAVVGSAWYFIDRRCQDVRVALDTNSDGLPDALQAAPYARSADYSYLLGARSLGAPSTGVVHASTVDLSGVTGHEGGWAVYLDTDADHVANSETLENARTLAPVLLGHPAVGLDKLYLNAGHATGKTAEVWLLDANGDDDTMLGSQSLASATWTGVDLSPALAAGDVIAVRFSNEPGDQLEFDVTPHLPQVHTITPHAIRRSQDSVIALAGQGFASGMTTYLRTAQGTKYTLSTTFSDSENATAMLPALTSNDEGLAVLWVVNPSDPPGASTTLIQIRP